jgi:hypothetical protein
MCLRLIEKLEVHKKYSLAARTVWESVANIGCPRNKDIFLQYNNMAVKIQEINTLIPSNFETQCQVFPVIPLMTFIAKWSSPESYYLFSYHLSFLVHNLIFMMILFFGSETLILLRITGQSLCRMFLSLDFSDVIFCLESGYTL